MSEVAGWGVPGWLPPAVRASIERSDAADSRAARAAEAEREQRVEARRQQALTLFREQATERGQVVDVMAMARGEVAGRSVQDVFAAAMAAADRDDAR